MDGRHIRRWWLLALLVVGTAAIASGAGGSTDAGIARLVGPVTAEVAVSAVAVQAAVLPWRAEEAQSALTRNAPEQQPLPPVAALVDVAGLLGLTRGRPRRRHEGPPSAVVALLCAVGPRAPPRPGLA